jgi:hypothetical protein
MNRRKAIGAMIGGVAAAPQVAKASMDMGQKLAADYGQEARPSNYCGEKTELVDRNYLIDRRKELEDLANGILSDSYLEKIEYENESLKTRIDTLNIQSMKSVSETHKQRMMLDKEQKRHKERIIEVAKKQLAAFLKNHGLI